MYSDALTELEETHGNDVQRQQDWAALLLAEQKARIDLQAQYEAELLACWVGEVAPVKQWHYLAEWETDGPGTPHWLSGQPPARLRSCARCVARVVPSFMSLWPVSIFSRGCSLA